MIENFVLNPPKRKGRKKMATKNKGYGYGYNPGQYAPTYRIPSSGIPNPKGKPKTKKGRAWRSLVKKYGVLKAAQKWKGGAKRMAANPSGKPKTKKGKAWQSLVKKYGVLHAARKWKGGAKRMAANPVSNSWPGQPRRHSKAAKKGWRAKKRYGYNPGQFTYKVAPVVANPVAVGTYLKPLIDVSFLTQTALPVTMGFIGSRLLGRKLATIGPLAKLPAFVQNVGLPLLVGVGGGVTTGLITKDTDIGMKVVLGSLVGILVDLIEKPIEKVLKLEGLDQEAEEMTEALKERIAKAIKTEVGKAQDTSTFVTEEAMPEESGAAGVGAFVETEALPAEQTEMGAFVETEALPMGGPGIGSVSLDQYLNPGQ